MHLYRTQIGKCAGYVRYETITFGASYFFFKFEDYKLEIA